MSRALVCASLCLVSCRSERGAAAEEQEAEPNEDAGEARATGAAADPDPLADREREAPACEAEGETACFETARAECDEAWTITLSSFGERDTMALSVSASGALRLELGTRSLYGTDSETWLGCTERCPGGIAEKLCFPYRMPLGYSFHFGRECEREVIDAKPWKGRASKRLRMECRTGKGVAVEGEVRFLPDLTRLREAFTRAGIIPADGVLASVEGFPVSATLRGGAIYGVEDIASTDCEAFAYPEGYRRIETPRAFADLRGLWPQLEHNLMKRARPVIGELFEEVFDELGQELRAELGRRCLGERERYPEEEVERCLREHPELKREKAKLAQTAPSRMDRLMEARSDALLAPGNELFDENVEAPLCSHFAAQR